jgi:Tol biopolymer transport system component
MRKRVPLMSVDGKIVVFCGYEGDNIFVYQLDLDGDKVQNLTSQLKNFGHPDITPDNQYIAFESPDGTGDIYTEGLDGSGLTRLTDFPGNDYDPAFLFQR